MNLSFNDCHGAYAVDDHHTPSYRIDTRTSTPNKLLSHSPISFQKSNLCPSSEMDDRQKKASSPMASSRNPSAKGERFLRQPQIDQGHRSKPIPIPSTSSNTIQQHVPEQTASSEQLFLRKISRMISDEQWHELDAFLSSPSEVAAYRGYSQQGHEIAQSFKWQKSPRTRHQANAVDEMAEMVASVNSILSLEDRATLPMTDVDPMEIVHFACRFNPPRTIIRHLASLYPEGVMYPDCIGRLPLHYAAKWGSSSKLIEYLVQKDRSAASVTDKLGKTPLHLICENYTSTFNSSSVLAKSGDISLEDHLNESIKILIDAAPDEVNIADNDDFTAIEYAIASDCPLKAVRRIQQASESDWKDRLKTCIPSSEGGKATKNMHEQIEEKLIQEHQDRQHAGELDRERKRMMGAMAQSRSRSSMQTHVSRNTVQQPRRRKPATRSKYAMSA